MADVLDSQVTPNIGVADTTVCAPSVAGAVRTIIGLSVANKTAGQITCSVKKKRGVTTVYLAKDAPVPVGGALIVIGAEQKVVVKQSTSDTITVSVSEEGGADVDCNYLEQTP